MNKNLLVLFLKAKRFTVDKDSNPDFIYVNSDDMSIGINLCKMTVYSRTELYSIAYGNTDITKLCQQLKENEKKYVEFIEEIKNYIDMDENDMKRYIVEHIEEVEF